MTFAEFKQLFASQISKASGNSKLHYGVRENQGKKMFIMAITKNDLAVAYKSLKNSKPDNPVKEIPWFTKS